MKQIPLILLFCCFIQTILAQDEENWFINQDSIIENRSLRLVKQFLELSVSANSYRGDLSSYQKWTSFFHAALKFNKAQRWNGRIGISSGFITGDNRLYKFKDETGFTSPNLFFRTNILSLDFELQYNLIKTRRWMLYLSQGFNILRFETKDEFGESLLEQLDSRALDETYGNFSVALPMGLGMNYLFKNGYGVGVQALFVNTTTDYLDNISNWGKDAGADNILRIKFSFLIPLKILPNQWIPPHRRKKWNYTHD